MTLLIALLKMRTFLLLAVLISSTLGQDAGDPSGLASVLLEANGKWRLEPALLNFESESRLLARANFSNTQNIDGWTHLQIETRPDADDLNQATAAGIAEGFLTRHLIMEKYNEFFGYDTCQTDPIECAWVRDKFRMNRDYVSSQITLHASTDPYWHQVNLIYTQMDGIVKGLRLRENGEDAEQFDYNMGVIMLNFLPDFWDLKEQYALINKNKTNTDKSSRRKRSVPSCSVLIKHLKESEDLMVAHNTWHAYSAMGFRVLKLYKFHYHQLPAASSELVAGVSISMSSYAGIVSSLDDFYITSAGLVATETTLFIWNKMLYNHLKTSNVVMEPVRVQVANRLAMTGQEWTEHFSRENSGTYNNQWMITDYNKFKMNPIELDNQVLMVLEQLPHMIVVDDQTDVLRKKSYWASYNRPFYSAIFEDSGAASKVERFGKFFTHNETNRALIFKRDQNKVTNMDSMMQLMRYNDFENDPLGVIEGCTPNGRNPAASIANRLDLTLNGSHCEFEEFDHMLVASPYGALDAKLTSKASMANLGFMAVAGPTHNGQMKPFQWSDTHVTQPRFKPIDKFDFVPKNYSWEFVLENEKNDAMPNNVYAPMLLSLIVCSPAFLLSL